MNKQVYGALSAFAAFTAWGFLPAYWKQMQAVSPFEILCHRVVWSCFFLAVIICVQKRWGEVSDIVKTPSTLKRLVLSGLLIGSNWFIYIWAVNSGRVVETSLGYYINPMINVVIGYLLLGERFSRIQGVAVLFALVGVVYSLIAYGALPIFALSLAISFAFYGYSRKKISAAPIPGLLIETMVLLFPALIYIAFKVASGNSFFIKEMGLTFWMVGSGVVTSLPLLWFASGTKVLNLSTIGILQYIAPSIAFCLGVFVYKEAFTLHNLITFGCIWAGVVLYSWESLAKNSRKVKKKKRS